jgi:hypothetical protein
VSLTLETGQKPRSTSVTLYILDLMSYPQIPLLLRELREEPQSTATARQQPLQLVYDSGSPPAAPRQTVPWDLGSQCLWAPTSGSHAIPEENLGTRERPKPQV